MHLCSAEARVLSYLLRHLHGLFGTNNVMLAVLDPLFGGGRATTARPFAHIRKGNTKFLFVAENKASVCYHEGTRVGLVFSEIWGDVLVSDRQDKSISRASVLFWMSAVRRWRASCKTLKGQTEQRSQKRCLRTKDIRAVMAPSHHIAPHHRCSKALSTCCCRSCCTRSMSSTSFFSCSSTGSATSSCPRRPSLSIRHSLLTSRGTAVAASACSVCSLD